MVLEIENGTNDSETARRMNPAGRLHALPRKTRLMVLASAAALPALIMLVLVVLLPVSRLRHSIAIDSANADKSAAPGERLESSALQRKEQVPLLRLDEAFWQARLKLAKQASIGITVDLADSIASVEVCGVPVRKCRIHRFKTSHAVNLVQNQSEFLVRISKPLNVQGEIATFPKEPIRIQRAPKDSVEANKTAARPFEPEKVEAYFTLFFDGDLSLAVEQLEEPSFKEFLRITGFRIKRYSDQAAQAISTLANLNLPSHRQRIEITLSRDDSKAIYRALSSNAACALRL
ncbi:MAG: hypothetical protein ABIA59_06790 [Candidatus Latescibacterota bacterium]